MAVPMSWGSTTEPLLLSQTTFSMVGEDFFISGFDLAGLDLSVVKTKLDLGFCFSSVKVTMILLLTSPGSFFDMG